MVMVLSTYLTLWLLQENLETEMVVSEIRSLYRDENDLFRTVIKRIYEEWDASLEQWNLKKIEFIFCEPDLPIPSDNIAVAVEPQNGWLIPRCLFFASCKSSR